MIDKLPFHDFELAGKAVLAFLHGRLGFGLWMLTRTEGEDWIVLQSEDHGYGVQQGNVFKWADSFCSEMVKGNGPRIAPDSQAVPVYASAPIGQQVPIKAYVGIPIQKEDGSLFGTLCAIDPNKQPETLLNDQGMIELLSELLTTILHTELRAANAIRRGERYKLEAHTDPLTRLPNRRAWDMFMTKEEERCRRYGHPAAIILIALEQPSPSNDQHGHLGGEALLMRAASALRRAVREADFIARLGEHELGIIAVETNASATEKLMQRIEKVFVEHEVNAAIGLAPRKPQYGLKKAWQSADRKLLTKKKVLAES